MKTKLIKAQIYYVKFHGYCSLFPLPSTESVPLQNSQIIQNKI